MSKKKENSSLPISEHGQASKFGQLIGEAFAKVVFNFIDEILPQQFPGYVLLSPAIGKKLVRLQMLGGTSRQMDNVITIEGSRDPVALFESKWLKDARHHNDKGAWILQLREMKKKYPTVRGAVAHLAGYWTEGVGVMISSEGGVKMVLVATDEQVYQSLQPHLDQYCEENSLDPLQLDTLEIRNSLPRVTDLARFLIDLSNSGELAELAKSWLLFQQNDVLGRTLLGGELILNALNPMLSPLPANPEIASFEISLQINTGNMIFRQFANFEEAMDFMNEFVNDPQSILEVITPKQDSDD